MRVIGALGTAALALSIALPAAAQSMSPMQSAPPTSAPASPPADESSPPSDAQAPSTSASPAPGADAGATVPVTAGLPVKDNTGATIGKVMQVRPDAGGKQTAVIAMGADTFAVDTAALAVQNGSAVINASQADIQGMIKKAAPPK
jgi:hypothetical protein